MKESPQMYKEVHSQLVDRLENVNLRAIVDDELSRNKRFSLYELSDEVLIHFNHKEKGKSTLNVGFPFPLFSSDFDADCYGMKLDIFIRGEPIRKLQRKLVKKLSNQYIEVNEGFKKRASNFFRGTERILYVDPYAFIGDSFIGLHFLDSFSHHLDVKPSVVFSHQYKHLNGVVNSREYTVRNVVKEIKENDLIVAPDLIDSHFEKTLMLIDQLSTKNVKMVIPARGLLLERRNGKLITQHANVADTLLKDKNIEDYMDEALSIFGVSPRSVTSERRENDSSVFFLNPFASNEHRYISPNTMFGVYRALKNADKGSEFYLISDYHHNPAHINWLNQFLGLMTQDSSLRRVGINYYSDLSELASHMKEKECGAVLSADTSIAHVANRTGYPCVTTYNPVWWDENSLQSLSGSSPAGFARYFSTQVPVINDGHNDVDLIAKAMLFSQRRFSDQVEEYRIGRAKWVKSLYNPRKVVKGIEGVKKGRHLISSAEKVSLEYKLEND